MYLQTTEVFKDLEKIFGAEAVEKIKSHFASCFEREKELVEARDKWKAKYYDLKNNS